MLSTSRLGCDQDLPDTAYIQVLTIQNSSGSASFRSYLSKNILPFHNFRSMIARNFGGSVAFIVENLRLRELAIVAEQNRGAFDDFVGFLSEEGYPSLHAFVMSQDLFATHNSILKYLKRPLPLGVFLYDGIARKYLPAKAKWLLLGWIFRDAPEQRLRPMIASMQGATALEKQARLLSDLRGYVGQIFPDAARWEWPVISEVVIDRLEGSRRAIKGTLFEAIVRRALANLFESHKLMLTISDAEIKLDGETYDVSIVGSAGRMLLPVKTRETMGGGHALLFTRDIHKSISVAHASGYECLPIIIAESWAGNLADLTCKDHIYINMNPNQLPQVEPALAVELQKRLPAFDSIK
jgi:hypothetical protein